MLRKLDERFTHFSLDVEEQISRRSLLCVPEKWWRYFKIITYIHAFFAILLFIFGSVCFCLGVEYSQYYSRVNCGDGVGIWPPLIAAVSGQYALRVLHLYWPPFVHMVLLIVSFPFLILVLIDSSIAVPWWENQPYITEPPVGEAYFEHSPFSSIFPPLRTTTMPQLPQWKYTFVDLDVSLSFLSSVNILLVSALLTFYFKWWFPINRR